MDLTQAIERMSKPPALGVRWDARDCEAGRMLVARLDKATELLRRALHWGPSGNDDTGADIRAFLERKTDDKQS